MAKGDDQWKNVRLTSACKTGFWQPCPIFHKHGDTGKVPLRNYIMNVASLADGFSIIELFMFGGQTDSFIFDADK